MPIISRIGRKSPKVRLLVGAMYVALTIGAITMIYPFLLMLSGSTKSAVDIKDLEIIPRFLYDDTALYQKHVEALFNEQLDRMKAVYDLDVSSFDKLTLPDAEDTQKLAQWKALNPNQNWMHTLAWELGYLRAPASKTNPLMLRRFKKHLVSTYQGDIGLMNRTLGTEFINWNAVVAPIENYMPRFQTPPQTPYEHRLLSFRREQDEGLRVPFLAKGFYLRSFIQTQYSRDIAVYNEAHGTRYASYEDVELSKTYPQQATPKEREDWEQFVRQTLNPLWIQIDHTARPAYRDFLQAKYGSIDQLNKRYQKNYSHFAGLDPKHGGSSDHGLMRSDWVSFLAGWKDPDTGVVHQPPVLSLSIYSLDFLFKDPPIQAFHYEYFKAHKAEIRHEFLIRNFATVFDYLLIHGKGVRNTVIYCFLAVLSALIVNPMAAYAMSRYRLPTTYKILLFMLLTMAFPPMVTQIPTFLMLRDFNLLNTFAALVLPGLAHGYSIFLLKGFFDSLPRELYESAQIDGANEWVMFWNITMTLSKPILAVIALQAFNLAYSNFMFALLFCQDQDMWTIMVWLYQLQSTSGQAVMYASLLIAAIPTFVIFAFCQNIIMRGIVVPVEK